MIERSHLQILREIEREGSLTAAAEALNLTQSALSHTIKKLESLLGVTLWTKEGRGLRFTQAGDYLLAESKRLLPQLERIDEVMAQFADGEKGALRIGMECYPCYQWLLKIVAPFLEQWPKVDVDVKQRFQFGGMAALLNHDVDILVTPDPLDNVGVSFTPVFSYEQVLVVNRDHALAERAFISPQDLHDEVLFTYPVSIERLDIYNMFLTPAKCLPKKRKPIEATEIMLQLVAAGRGVATLPKWLVAQYESSLPLTSVRLGEQGIEKSIHLGMRGDDASNPYIQSFLTMAKSNALFT